MSAVEGRHGQLTPLAEAEVGLARAAQKGRSQRIENGQEMAIETSRHRANGAEHRADLNVGSMGSRRGRRGHRGIGQ